MMINKKYYWTILIILVLFLFRVSLTNYFSQDDFFHFQRSQIHSLADIWHFFSFNNGNEYGFYRPLSNNLYFGFGQLAFGNNPAAFRWLNIGIFVSSSYLVYQILKHLTKDEHTARLATVIYATAAFHLTTLSYLSATEELLLAFFTFLTVYCFQKDSRLAIVFFVLALLTREPAVVLPLLLTGLCWLTKKPLGKLLPYFLIVFGYCLLRLLYHLTPDTNIYQLTFLPAKVLNNGFWYLLWGLGAPEGLVDFIGPGLRFNSRFLAASPYFGSMVLVLLPVLVLMIGTGFIKWLSAKPPKREFTILLLLTGWCVLTLLPYVFLKQHRFAYYLEVPFLGLSGLIAQVYRKQRKLGLVIVILFLLISVASTGYYNTTYWAINRGMMAKEVLTKLAKQYPTLSTDNHLYFANDPKYVSPIKEWGSTSSQIKTAISGCNGVNFIYQTDDLFCYFEDDKPRQENIKDARVFQY